MQDFHRTGGRANGRWTKQEHFKFLEGIRIYGKNWKKIQQLIQTRTGSQIRSHAQKFFLKSQQLHFRPDQDQEAFEDEAIEEAEEATLNSKTVSESTNKQQDFSYFFQKIVKHWQDKQSLDFWASLVDSRGATVNLNQSLHHNSFTNVNNTSKDSLHQCKEQIHIEL